METMIEDEIIEMCEADTSSSISDNECSVSVSSSSNLKAPPRKRKKASFLDEWAQKWPWAEDMPDGPRCKLCIKHRKQNKLTRSGCTNYKTTTLKQQAESNTLKEALH